MNKVVGTALVFIAISFVAGSVYAGNGCPVHAERLEDFAGCMQVMPGNAGTMYRGTLADMNGNHTAQLLNAVHASVPIVRPRYVAYPASVGYYPSMVSAAASMAYKNNPHRTYWTWYAVHNMAGYPR